MPKSGGRVLEEHGRLDPLQASPAFQLARRLGTRVYLLVSPALPLVLALLSRFSPPPGPTPIIPSISLCRLLPALRLRLSYSLLPYPHPTTSSCDCRSHFTVTPSSIPFARWPKGNWDKEPLIFVVAATRHQDGLCVTSEGGVCCGKHGDGGGKWNGRSKVPSRGGDISSSWFPVRGLCYPHRLLVSL